MEQIGKQEQIRFTSKTITIEELGDLIYRGKSLPQEKRFLSMEKGGVFKYFNLEDFNSPFGEKKFYPIIMSNDRIVGLSELEEKSDEKGVFWIKFISIDPKYRNKGCASRLAEEIFMFAKRQDFSLENSSYFSNEGYKRLRKVLRRLAEKYGVKFIDQEKKSINKLF